MNSTNRFLNRTLILVVGLILLLAGAAVAVGALLPDVQSEVARVTGDSVDPTTSAIQSQPWILWVTAAVALVLIVILLRFVLGQGRGRTATLLRTDGVVLDTKLTAQVLEEALSKNTDIVSIDVVSFRIRRRSVLRITAQAHKGASPAAIRSSIEAALVEWDAVLGSETPAMIQIVGGFRNRMTSTTRVA